MLVLTRKLDESIKIGDDIKVTILRVKGNTIRIGIEAPRDVRVIRSELKSAIAEASNDSETLATVTAIVDSPTIAGPRLFVGKATTKALTSDKSADSQLPEIAVNLDLSEFATGSQLPPYQAAPLRAFLRSSHGLTAV